MVSEFFELNENNVPVQLLTFSPPYNSDNNNV